jgi:chromosome segregation ATPase
MMEAQQTPAPQIIADGTGVYSPNPRFYGFDWPEVQAVFDRGHRLFERRSELGHEQQDLTAEKRGLENDLLQAQAGLVLAGAGLQDTQISDAATTADVPKSRKRIAAIEKRLAALDSDLAALDLAVQRHKGDLEHVLAVARHEGTHAAEIGEANQNDLLEVQDLEARAQQVRARIGAREQLGELLGIPTSGLAA